MQRFRKLAILTVIVLATLLVIAFGSKPAEKDFISFWSAGQLIARHQNPYDTRLVLQTEVSQGYSAAKPLVMRNPPWMAPLVYPLHLLNARMGLMIWMIFTVASVVLCLHIYPVDPRDRVFAYLFAPVYACLATGQSSMFALLGFLLFIFFRRKSPAGAGAALALMALKPHLFLVLFPIMALDILFRREFRVIAGFVTALAIASAYGTWLDHHIWKEYVTMLHGAGLDAEFHPTPAFVVGYVLAPGKPWVELLPSALAIGWAVQNYIRRGNTWDLRIDAAPLLLLSLLTSPYAWLNDEILLLPVLLMVMGSAEKARYVATAFLITNACVFVLLVTQVKLTSGAYIWTTTAWTVLYLYNLKYRTQRKQATLPAHLQAA